MLQTTGDILRQKYSHYSFIRFRERRCLGRAHTRQLLTNSLEYCLCYSHIGANWSNLTLHRFGPALGSWQVKVCFNIWSKCNTHLPPNIHLLGYYLEKVRALVHVGKCFLKNEASVLMVPNCSVTLDWKQATRKRVAQELHWFVFFVFFLLDTSCL